MANRIKGITVEIGGDTSGLEQSLSSVNSAIKNTQSQLKDVNSLLKLDPSNITLLAQKQELLTDAIAQTTQKLQALEQAQREVQQSFQRGDIGKEQYMAFQREVEATRGILNRYKADLSSLQIEQDQFAANTERLSKLFDATGKSLDDFVDVLGTRLSNAIRNGSASADQLRQAVEKIGKAVSGGKTDIGQLIDALDTVDDGQALRNLIEDLNQVGDAAQDAADDMDEIAQATTGTAVMQAADQLSVVGDKLQEFGSAAVDAYSEAENAASKVSTYFGETGDAAEASSQIVKEVYGSGVGDSMDTVADAIIMVRKNLGDLSDTDLSTLTKQAITLDQLYGIDMNETLRGVNSLMKQYGMTAQQAMDYIVTGTQNGLDKTNELGDNLSEYAGKFAQAGYSASDYFQLLDNGLQGGAYNLDKVNDAINEVTTRLADGTIEESIGIYSAKTQELFLSWQQGGATQNEVIDSIVADIASCTSQQDALNMAAQAFGTMAEDGNLKFITSLTSVGTAYENVKGSAEGMFDSALTPTQQMEANTRQLQQSLVPLGEKLVELANVILPPLVAIITAVSSVFSSLPEPVQNFIIILGALLVAFTAIVPVIAALSVAFGALNISIFPIIAIIAAVAVAIVGIIAIIQNWGAIVEWIGGIWEGLKSVITTVVGAIADFLSSAWDGIKSVTQTVWNGIAAFFTSIWNGIKLVTQTVWNGLSLFLSTIWNSIILAAQTIWNGISLFFSMLWTGIQTTIQFVWTAISTFLYTVWNTISVTAQTIWNGISNFLMAVWTAISNAVQTIWNGIAAFFSALWANIQLIFSTALSVIQSILSAAWSAITTAVSAAFEVIKTVISTAWKVITSIISTALEIIKTLVTTAWDAIKTAILTVMEAIKTGITAAWEAIKTAVVTVVTDIKDAVIQIWENIKDAIIGIIESLIHGLIAVWNSLKDAVISVVENIKDAVINVFNGLKDGVSNAMNNVLNAVKNGFSVVKEYILDLAKSAFSWGKDLIMGIVNGIKSAMSAVRNAVYNVAEIIRSVLHFSVPDVGPLTDYESWMPDFMSGLAKGIEKSRNMVRSAIDKVANDMVLSPHMTGTMDSILSGGQMQISSSSTSVSDSTLADKLDTMCFIMTKYLPKLVNSKVVLDSGALVGELTDGINRELGRSYL